MAAYLSQAKGLGYRMKAKIGKQLLDVITTGMYSDPKMAIREYIQNASDSIDEMRRKRIGNIGSGTIRIAINGEKREITVEDNGLGIPHSEVAIRLCTLGQSNKTSLASRGYRGIGRLGGLAYCESLRFETRSKKEEPVSIVEWKSKYLASIIDKAATLTDLSAVLSRICTNRYETRRNEPAHFFRVIMNNVRRFHSDTLMSQEEIRQYLSHTAPVGFDFDRFSHAEKVAEHCAKVPGYAEYKILLNEEEARKPYSDYFQIGDKVEDRVKAVELFDFTNSHGECIARGWFGVTDLFGSIKQSNKSRGIRIRQGNIEVGDESFLTKYFTEPRFATWHIGEIHVSPAIRLNARRDGFEESAGYEALLEKASALCKHLSALCRSASKRRSKLEGLVRLMTSIEAATNLPFFIDQDHLRTHARNLKRNMETLSAQKDYLEEISKKHKYQLLKIGDSINEMIANAKFMPDMIDTRKIRPIDSKSMLIKVCKDIFNMSQTNSKYHMITHLIKDYLR
jgi:hypothetical protein